MICFEFLEVKFNLSFFTFHNQTIQAISEIIQFLILNLISLLAITELNS